MNATPEERTAENERLVTAFRSGGIRAACAIVPRLTESGVWMRLRRLGEIKRRQPHRLWTMGELRMIEQMREQGLPSREMAARLGRTKYSVDGQIRLMIADGRLPAIRPVRHWTSGSRKIVDRSIDQLLEHLAVRLDRSPDAVRHEVWRSLRQWGLRRSPIASRQIA
jgi:hypothetical protein